MLENVAFYLKNTKKIKVSFLTFVLVLLLLNYTDFSEDEKFKKETL